MKKITLTIMVCLLLVTIVTANPILIQRDVEIVDDNDFLRINPIEIINPGYNGYQKEQEYVLFYFNVTTFNRVQDINMNMINKKILESIDTQLSREVLDFCIPRNDCRRFIIENEIQIINYPFNNKTVETISMQRNRKLDRIRNKINEIKIEIRRDENDLDEYLRGLEIEV